MCRFEEAKQDAESCTMLKPSWPKGTDRISVDVCAADCIGFILELFMVHTTCSFCTTHDRDQY